MITAYACPVLAFTPQIEADLELFRLTHELRAGAGWLRWEMVRLPASGGVEDQPSRTMAVLGWIAAVSNRALAEVIQVARARSADAPSRGGRG